VLRVLEGSRTVAWIWPQPTAHSAGQSRAQRHAQSRKLAPLDQPTKPLERDEDGSFAPAGAARPLRRAEAGPPRAETVVPIETVAAARRRRLWLVTSKPPYPTPTGRVAA
jgi:hypothetical protein